MATKSVRISMSSFAEFVACDPMGQLSINPELVVKIDNRPIVLKLHLKERVPLNQRLANPEARNQAA